MVQAVLSFVTEEEIAWDDEARCSDSLALVLHCVPKNVYLFIFQITLSKINWL